MAEQLPIPDNVTPEMFFEQMMPMGFAAQQAENPSVTPREMKMQFVLTGDGGGEWAITIADGAMNVIKGKHDAHVCMTISTNDWRDAVTGQNGANIGLIIPQPRPGKPDNTAQIKNVKGTLAMELAREGMDPFRVENCFNGAATPRTLMKLKLSEFLDMQTGKLNGQEAFMTGRIKVEGDLGFLMQIAMLMA